MPFHISSIHLQKIELDVLQFSSCFWLNEMQTELLINVHSVKLNIISRKDILLIHKKNLCDIQLIPNFCCDFCWYPQYSPLRLDNSFTKPLEY